MRIRFAKLNDTKDVKRTILLNRGVENPDEYLNTAPRHITPYNYLANIDRAYEAYEEAVKDGRVGIVVDSDPDGQASAAILFQLFYKKGIEPKFYIHESKGHGLTDRMLMAQVVADVNAKLVRYLFVPDAGSNDVNECRNLSILGCKTIILDHHDIEKQNDHAIVVNPNLSPNYDNKHLSGAGVVWQFLRKIDDMEWTDESSNYTDLVAFSLISDSMDIRSLENREIINEGLSNIKNLLLKALIEKQSYSMRDEITPISISYYVVPIINGLVRVGTREEKELMFQAFCQLDQEFDYEKRNGEHVQENIYVRVARLAANAKAKQDRLVEKGMEAIDEDIYAHGRNLNKILFARSVDGIDQAFTGLIAQKLATKYNKPCVLLRQGSNHYYTGSLRGFTNCPLTDIKGFLKSLDCAEWISGHPNAAGIGLFKNQLVRMIELSNEKLSDYDFTPVHHVDFELHPDQLTRYILHDLNEMRPFYGQQMPEALVCLRDVKIKSSDIVFMGKEGRKNTWKFILDDDNKIDVIKFNIGEGDDFLNRYADGAQWDADDLTLDLVVKVTQSEFNGELRWLLLCEDYEIIGKA